MAFFSGYIGTIIFALCIGVVLTIVAYLLLTVYVFPYLMWIGVQNGKGKHKDMKKESVFKAVRNATKLYKAWITKTEPTF